MNSLKKTLLSLLQLQLFCYCSYKVVTGTTSFDTETLPFSGFKFLGDAHVLNHSLSLSPDILTPNSGAGRVLYRKPIRFRKPGNRIPLSFSTNFSLLITNSNRDCAGGGVALVISPDDDVIGGSGAHMGIPSGAFAIEFDTQRDVELEDINGNHVGVNLGSMVSSNVVNLDLFEVDLRSGRPVNAWVVYSGETGKLDISISYKNTKPKFPVLSVPSLDLNHYVNEFMYIGFTASTQGNTETHSLSHWSFRSSFAGHGANSKPRNSPLLPPSSTTVKKSHQTNSNIPTQIPKKWGHLLKTMGIPAAVVVTACAYYCVRHLQCCHRNCNNNEVFCC